MKTNNFDMNILQEIANHQKELVALKRETHPIEDLKKSLFFDKTCKSITTFINDKNKMGLISEFKRASPSNKNINPKADPLEICPGYMNAGASALSILTNEVYFSGKNSDVEIVAEQSTIPILRKEFIVDEYQIYETKAIGADVILLILSLLTKQEIKEYINLAHDLGLEVLAEIHDREDLVSTGLNADLIGVNSRSLKQMKILPDHHEKIYHELQIGKPMIAESGIKSAEQAYELSKVGYKGFLIGSHFMSKENPVLECENFVNKYDEIRGVMAVESINN